MGCGEIFELAMLQEEGVVGNSRVETLEPGVNGQIPGLLSVCIPVFNFNVTDTVKLLLNEVNAQGLNVEVVVFDDCSQPIYEQWNASLSDYDRVRYLPLLTNIGRSKIRNRLADYARGEWLLFLDCDMQPVYSDFLMRYFSAMSGAVDVVCGGVMFENKPQDKWSQLQWRYRKCSVRQRDLLLRRDPASGVEVGNFMIRHSLYNCVGFDEDLAGYGQEDKVFVYTLSRMKARVQFIQNPTEHLGKDKNDKFLLNIEASSVNMVRVWNKDPQLRKYIARGNRHLMFVVTMQRLHLLGVLLLVLRMLRVGLQRRLEAGYALLSSLRFYQMCCIAEAFARPNLHDLHGKESSV